MRRNCLFIPLEEIKNQFKENTRQDVKIVAPEILSEQLFNMLIRKGKMLKMEKPLAAEKWTYSKKNRPNFICKSSDFSINNDQGLSKVPGPEGPALIIPGGDLVYRHLTIYGVLEYWSDGVMDEPPFYIAIRKQTPGENLQV